MESLVRPPQKKGILCGSPADSLRQGFKLGLVKDNRGWIRMLKDRNLAVHTYEEVIADKIYGRLKAYAELFSELLSSIKRRR